MVLLSLAEFTHHHNQMIVSMREIEEKLQSASTQSSKPEEALGTLIAAYKQAQHIIRDRKESFHYLRTIWEKSRYPKGRSVDGREFYHELDDIKDLWALSQPDLSFYTAPEERINMEEWIEKLSESIKKYAGNHDIHINASMNPDPYKYTMEAIHF